MTALTADRRDGVRLLEQTTAALIAADGRPAGFDVLSAPISGDYPTQWRGVEYRLVRPDPLPGAPAQSIGTLRLYADDLDAAGLTLVAFDRGRVEVARASFTGCPAPIVAASAREMVALLARRFLTGAP